MHMLAFDFFIGATVFTSLLMYAEDYSETETQMFNIGSYAVLALMATMYLLVRTAYDLIPFFN